jgi:hypothetical protein
MREVSECGYMLCYVLLLLITHQFRVSEVDGFSMYVCFS